MSENKGNNQLRNFTQKELESFEGKEGFPFYVVFKGKVCDLSKIQFGIQGTHMGIHTRNENLAESIKKAPHTEETLQQFPSIGTFSEKATPAPTPTMTIIKTSGRNSCNQHMTTG